MLSLKVSLVNPSSTNPKVDPLTGIKFDGCHQKVRAAELRALCVTCFMADDAEDWTAKILQLICSVLEDAEDELLTEALECW